MLAIFRQINTLIRDGTLATDIGTIFSLGELSQALQEAEKVGRGGKVLLRIS
jgi:predicted amino acid racemase